MVTKALLRKSTLLLGVDRIEPVLEFWEKLGLTPIIQVPSPQPSDGSLAFVILEAGEIEIMYQTVASLKNDLLKNAALEGEIATTRQAILYISVSSLEKVERQLLGERLIMPRRTSPHGTIEAVYAEPAGNLVVFVENHARDSKVLAQKIEWS